MAFHQFQISTYRVSLYPLFITPPTRFIRLLRGPTTPDVADLNFYPASSQVPLGTTVVPNPPTQPGFTHRCTFAAEEFDTIHRLLQTEKPLFIEVRYEDAPVNVGSRVHRITRSVLFTGDEPLGEGPQDRS